MSRNRKSVIATMFALGIAIMSGSAFYVANYSAQNRNNLSLKTDSNVGAANPSCSLDLTINRICDLNLDGVINITDQSLMTSYVQNNNPLGDLNRDGVTNIVDMAIFQDCYKPFVTPTPIVTATPTSLVTPTPTPGILRTSTPTASPITCSLCQYQLDMFWGPVITMFTGTDTYSSTKRLIGSKFDTTTLPVCALNATSAQTAPTLPVLATSCADPVTKGYLTGYIDSTTKKSPAGYASALITNNTTNCTYDVGFASYKANGGTLSLQNLYDFKTTDIGKGLAPKTSVKFYIKTPMIGDSAACHNLPL